MLLGRQRELQALTDLLDAANQRGAALLLRSEAGMGKSALLAAAKQQARDLTFHILSTSGVQSEAHLPFAGLHQLLRPVLAEVDRLPAPQREAMRAAFGMSDAAAPDLFFIALATLNLLSEAATHTPVLLVVDDAQWIDRATADVVAFVARRLEADPIVLLSAVRRGYESVLVEAGLPELCLESLDHTTAAALLDARAPELAPSVRERVLREAAGNPLALIELPVALRSAGIAGETRLPTWLPLTARLEYAFAARRAELPEVTRRLLLVAAVDEGAVLVELLQAAAVMAGRAVTLADVAPAVSAGLVEVDQADLRFSHPLMRSAVYQAVGLLERQAAHAALAAVLTAAPDRRAWHRAASVVGTDEEVAVELAATATRAQRRGGNVSAIAALERAAMLTDDPRRRGTWLLRAAELALELGRLDVVARLLRATESLELLPTDVARMAWIQEMIDTGSPGDPARVRALVEMADRMSSNGASDLALNLLWAAATSGFWADRGEEAREEILAVADRVPVRHDNPRLLSILAYAAPMQRGAAVIAHVLNWKPDSAVDPAMMQLLGNAAATVGAFDLSEGFLTASANRLREQGRLVQLAQVLVLRAWTEIHLGRWNTAMTDAEEASRLAEETAQPIWGAGGKVAQSMLAGLRGEVDAAEATATEAERVGLILGARAVLAVVQLARGLTALGARRHAEAYAHLQRMFDPADPAHHHMESCWAIGNLAEAALHSGHRDEARTVVERLEPLLSQTPSPWFHIAMRYARALLADDEEAEALFQEAMRADLTRWPFDRARLELAHGTWLRRQRRVAESRAPLRTARDAFDALGAHPWSEMARQELRAAGEASRSRTPNAWNHLTPQEFQIAQMVADGMTNKEIGQHLYLSHRTVGSHLYRIFPKLGITARSQLRDALKNTPGLPV